MLRIVAYDIADPRRLRRVADACEDFGTRIQKSVFECWLDDARHQALKKRLVAEMDEAEDAVIIYSLDAGAAKRRDTLGQAARRTDPQPDILFF